MLSVRFWMLCGRRCCIGSLLCVFVVAIVLRSNLYDENSTLFDFSENILDIGNRKAPVSNIAFNFSTIGDPFESSTLIDLHDFKFLINNQRCLKNNTGGRSIYLTVLIHSSPKNFERRKSVRKTWGSEDTISGISIRLVFLLGAVNDEEIQVKINQENDKYHDIVQGNFLDSYRNLTYKHVMGLKWVTYYCREAKYVLKVDDDVFVDIYQMVNFLQTGPNQNRLYCLVCFNCYVKRGYRTEKWRVTFKEYPNRYYPPFCAGIGVITSPSISSKLYAMSSRVPYFWIDDVYVTGILTEKTGVKLVDMSANVTYLEEVLDDWLADERLSQPILIAHNKHFDQIIYAVWNKTMDYYRHASQVLH